MDKKQLMEQVKKDGVLFVSLQFTDIMGTIKSVTLPVGRLARHGAAAATVDQPSLTHASTTDAGAASWTGLVAGPAVNVVVGE